MRVNASNAASQTLFHSQACRTWYLLIHGGQCPAPSPLLNSTSHQGSKGLKHCGRAAVPTHDTVMRRAAAQHV